MSTFTLETIQKSWKVKDDEAVVREVATKGEHMQLCIDYLKQRRQISVEEATTFFKKSADAYIDRLLSDKLVCKAEDVLRNLSRDFRPVYYQFAFQCQDEDLKNVILNHINKKDPANFLSDKTTYEFNWTLLEEIKKQSLTEIFGHELKVLNLEWLYQMTESFRANLLIEVYFSTKKDLFAAKLDKISVWRYLVDKSFSIELIAWLYAQDGLEVRTRPMLYHKYTLWSIDDNMLEYASKYLKNSSNVLRNCFCKRGIIFSDESKDIKKVLSRVFTTETYQTNKQLLPPSLPIGEYLYKNEIYPLLLDDFVTVEEIENIKENCAEKNYSLKLISKLKTADFLDKDSLITVFKAISQYLEHIDPNHPDLSHPMVLLFEVLMNDFSLTDIESLDRFKPIRELPYMDGLIKRVKGDVPNPVTVEEMLKKFKNINLDEVSKDAGDEPVSFSNSNLRQKYSCKFKLNYLHYIKQYRGSYAVYHFYLEQLEGYSSISHSHLFGAVQVVSEFALQNYNNPSLVLHSVSFIEILGFDSENLRCLIKLIKTIDNQPKQLKLQDIVDAADSKIFAEVNSINTDNFPLEDYTTLMQIARYNQLRKLPEKYLLHLAAEDDWLKIIIIMQYFNIPVNNMKNVFKHFKSPTIGENLLRAVMYEPHQEKVRRRPSTSRTKPRTKTDSNSISASGETMVSSISSSNEQNACPKPIKEQKFLQDTDNPDLFAIIILSNSNITDERIPTLQKFLEVISDSHCHHSFAANLMRNSIKHEIPVLAILSIMVSDINLDWCWMVYMAVSMRAFLIFENSKDPSEIVQRLINYSIEKSFVRTLNRGFYIFYKNNKFNHFTKFLQLTVDLEFSYDAVNHLGKYLHAWGDEDLQIPLNEFNKDQIMDFTVRLLILHIRCNFQSGYDQQMLLNIICQFGISDINQIVDFCLLKKVFPIICKCRLHIDIENLLEPNEDENECIHLEYRNALKQLLDSNNYDEAIHLSIILDLPVSDIVLTKWMNRMDPVGDINLTQYEMEIEKYSLAPELLMKFYLDVAFQISNQTPRKYLLLKKSLDVFKKNRLFPNEYFDSDQIEFEMIVCYLQSDQKIENLDIYNSEYFEEILLNERCVLYKSFSELKSLAGIDDLSTSLKIELSEDMKQKLASLLNKLLDDGDIVEALRLQAMFEYRTIDLHFIVFCMALAEGLTTIYDLSKDERELLTDVEKSSITKFDKRTLGRVRTPVEPQINKDDSIDSTSTAMGFEEIPSREKKKVLDALQSIASRLKYGVDLGRRIVMSYRAAMHLEKEYLDCLRMKDTMYLLKSATEEDCLHKLLVVSDILTSTKMTHIEVAEYLSHEIATAIIRPRFYIFLADQPTTNLCLRAQNILWGHHNLDKEMHLFLELCPNTTILGNCILEYCDALKVYRRFQDKKSYQQDFTHNPHLELIFNSLCQIIQTYGQPLSQSGGTTQVLSHKKQNIICVELLIKAHECFIHECSMEGMANILNRAKALNSILCSAKSWSLIVRMLTGIGRYREMYFCFDTLIKNEQFESLLGQFDEEKTNGLRHGIISYIQEHCPENREYLKLAALHFLMYSELAGMWEQEANNLIAKLLSENQISEENNVLLKRCDENKTSLTSIKCSEQVLNSLNQILDNLTLATENYLLDNKLRLATKSVSNAELIAMQIDLVNKGMNSPTKECISVLNIRTKNEFKELVNTELRVAQALILSRAYLSYEINWSDAILSQYVLLGKTNYLQEYINHLELSDSTIENVVKSFQLHSHILPGMEENLSNLVGLVQSVCLRYKLASVLGLRNIVTSLINDASIYYLKDTNYGRNEPDLPEN